jgi:hypothetical protein
MPDKSKQYCINFQRELYWSRAVAVGDEDWLNKIQGGEIKNTPLSIRTT